MQPGLGASCRVRCHTSQILHRAHPDARVMTGAALFGTRGARRGKSVQNITRPPDSYVRSFSCQPAGGGRSKPCTDCRPAMLRGEHVPCRHCTSSRVYTVLRFPSIHGLGSCESSGAGVLQTTLIHIVSQCSAVSVIGTNRGLGRRLPPRLGLPCSGRNSQVGHSSMLRGK